MKTSGITQLISLICFLWSVPGPAQETNAYNNLWFETRKMLGDRYDMLAPCSEWVAVVQREGRYGIVNREGQELAPVVYEQIDPMEGGVLVVQQEGKFGAFSDQGDWIVPVGFAAVKTFPLSPGAVACRRDSLFAIFDRQGKQMTPFQFRAVRDVTPGRIVARTGTNAWGAWDMSGKLLIPERYDELRALPCGFWQGCLLGQCALLDAGGTPRTQFAYYEVVGFPGGHYLASVSPSQSSTLYWFDASGKRLSNTIATLSPARKHEGLYVPQWPEGYVLLPWQGEPVLQPGDYSIRTQAGAPAEWKLLVRSYEEESEELGWKDFSTGLTMLPKYQYVAWQNGRIFASDYEKTDVYDRENHLLKTLPFRVELVPGAHTWIFHANNGAGLCDTAFRIILPAAERQLYAQPWGGFIEGSGDPSRVYDPDGRPVFKEPVANAGQDRENGQRLIFSRIGKMGLADFFGKIVVQPVYDQIQSSCPGGNYVAIQHQRAGLLNHAGKLLLPFEYDRIECAVARVFKIRKQGKYGLADAQTGTIILSPVFDDIRIYGASGIQARRDGRFQVFDLKGRELASDISGIAWLAGGIQLVNSGGRWGITGKNFQPVESFRYDEMYFREGVITAREGAEVKRWLNHDGRLIPTSLERIRYLGDWGESACWGQQAGRWGLFGPDGRALIQPEYDQITAVGQAGILAVLRQGRKAGVWTVKREKIAQFDADTLLDCQSGFIRYRLDGQTWLRNLRNDAVMTFNGDTWSVYSTGELLALRSGKGVQLFSSRLQPVFQGILDDFPEFYEYQCGLLKAAQNGRYGLLRADGTVVLPFEYDQIDNTSGSMYVPFYYLYKGNKLGLYSCITQQLLPAIYDSWSYVDTTGFILAGSEGRMALFSPEMKQLTGFELSYAEPFGHSFFLVAKDNRHYALTDRAGKAVIAGEIQEARRLGAFLTARQNGKAGLIGPDGRLTLHFQYDQVEELGPSAFRTSVYKNDALYQQRLFDHGGKAISREPYQRVELLNDSTFFVWDAEERQGVIALDGRVVFPLEHRTMLCWHNVCAVQKNGKWGLFRPDGGEMLPYQFDFIDSGEEGALTLGKGGLYGYFDAGGYWLTPLQYDYADVFSMGRAAVRRNGKWGFVDLSGKESIPLRFGYAENFPYNGAETVVLLDGRYMLIDTNGIVTRAFPYDQPRASAFFHRRLEYENKAGKGTVLRDNAGRVLLQKPNLRFLHAQGGLLQYAKDSYDECTYPPYGLMNYAGTPVGQAVYTHLDPAHLGVCYMIPAIRDKRWGFLDGYGHEIIPCEYDRVWNLYEPFKNGEWEGGVHLQGKSWIVNRFGKWIRAQ